MHSGFENWFETAMNPKFSAPPIYKPGPQKPAAPPAYRPAQINGPVLQPKPVANLRIEARPAPPVYRPQAGVSTSQPKALAHPIGLNQAVQPQTGYQLSSPIWVGTGRQQIRVTAKGSPTPVGTVDVHYDNGKAFISDLEVVQGHRRHGVGTMLMKAAMDSARRNGSSATELEANPGPGSISKQSLVGMYQKLGFKGAGSTRRGNPLLSTRAIAQGCMASRVPAQIQKKTLSPSSASTIQRSQGVTYTSIGSHYSAQEIQDAGGPTAAHGSGKPGDGISGKTLKENAELAERLRENREHAKEEKKQAIVSALAEKKAGKEMSVGKLKREAKKIMTNATDQGTGLQKATDYLEGLGLADEIVEEILNSL
jgi:GNAT superfamily N-acetyltransferase